MGKPGQMTDCVALECCRQTGTSECFQLTQLKKSGQVDKAQVTEGFVGPGENFPTLF